MISNFMGDRLQSDVSHRLTHRWLQAGIVVVILGTTVAGATASNANAQSAGTPDAVVLETLIKRYLLAFNHANMTGNYAVFHALLHPRFSARYSPEQLSKIFMVFRRKKVDLGIISTKKPRIAPAPRVDNEGRLQVIGWFATRPSRVLFRIILRRDGRIWKLTNIHISVRQPKAAPDDGNAEDL